ncbi:MAG: energy-coupling factor ABC transporter permease [Opitutaceae bacterium]
MHLIQGTLDSSTTLLTSAAGIFAFGAAAYGARHELSAKSVLPLVGLAGFVFFAQMVNMATGFGFSGHLVGAALLAILFGPCLAMLSMATILTLQVALLGDGSFSTLGANFITMGVVAPWSAYAVYRFMQGRRTPQADVGQVVAVSVASLVSIFAAALSLNLLLGGGMALPMLSIASVWAVLEAALSVCVFALCVRSQNALNTGHYATESIALLCVMALCLTPFSSTQADGLEHILENAQLEVR